MSLVASTPQTGTEMEDSAMQEDHLADSAIAIDMEESPKHHGMTPHGASYGDNTAATSFWSHSQSQETVDQLVDVEFETAGAYEDDGMMAATEVEMMAAAPYEDDNELEMAYETGQPEFNYEVEDAEVRDADVSHEEHSHEPASHFVHVEHEQPQDTLVVPAPEIEAYDASDPLPFAEVVADTGFTHEEVQPELAPSVAVVGTDGHEEDPVPEVASESHHPAETTPAVLTELVEEPAQESTVESTEDNLPLALPEEEEVYPGTTDIEAPNPSETVLGAEEVSVEVYETDVPEEVNTESRYDRAAPSVLLTMTPESAKSVMVALFSEPDVAVISSSAPSTPPVVLLDKHHYLFGAPVVDLLAHLRTELLGAQSEIMPRSEFEYKEVQLVVRDLQLVLTEDNIYSREISLLDLESMHRSCGLSGYLHLDFSMQPRFIDRYRAIRQAIEAQGIVNNPDSAIQQGGKDEEKPEKFDTITASADQVKSLQAEADGTDHPETEATQTLPRQEGDEDQDDVGEGEGEEPPLPLDDGEASSWSEEQEDDAAPAEEGQPDEEHVQKEWDQTHELDTAVPDEAPAAENAEGEEYEEEYVHEDDYVPGDLVRIEDDPDLFGDEEGEYGTAESTEPTFNVFNESTTGDGDCEDEAGSKPAAEVEANLPEESLHQTDDAIEATEEPYDEGVATAEEVTEYVDDENEWDDLGYHPEPPTASLGTNESSSTTQPEKDPLLERKASNGHWTGTSDAMSPPQRKRSFSEVEAEPEGNLSHSPGSKKPRHL